MLATIPRFRLRRIMCFCHSQEPNNWEGRGAMLPIHIIKGQASSYPCSFFLTACGKRGERTAQPTKKNLSLFIKTFGDPLNLKDSRRHFAQHDRAEMLVICLTSRAIWLSASSSADSFSRLGILFLPETWVAILNSLILWRKNDLAKLKRCVQIKDHYSKSHGREWPALINGYILTTSKKTRTHPPFDDPSSP